MGWSTDIYIIAGALVTEEQAEELYDNYIKGKKKMAPKTKQSCETKHSKRSKIIETRSLYCIPEDEKLCVEADPEDLFENCDFSIAKSLELPSRLQAIFPHTLYLMYLRDESRSDKYSPYCVFFQIQNYSTHYGGKVVKVANFNKSELQRLLDQLDVKENRLQHIKTTVAEIPQLAFAQQTVCDYYHFVRTTRKRKLEEDVESSDDEKESSRESDEDSESSGDDEDKNESSDDDDDNKELEELKILLPEEKLEYLKAGIYVLHSAG